MSQDSSDSGQRQIKIGVVSSSSKNQFSILKVELADNQVLTHFHRILAELLMLNIAIILKYTKQVHFVNIC